MAIWKIQLEFVVASECSSHVTAFHALDLYLVDLVLPRFAHCTFFLAFPTQLKYE